MSYWFVTFEVRNEMSIIYAPCNGFFKIKGKYLHLKELKLHIIGTSPKPIDDMNITSYKEISKAEFEFQQKE